MKYYLLTIGLILFIISCEKNEVVIDKTELDYYKIEDLNPPVYDSDITGRRFTEEVWKFVKSQHNKVEQKGMIVKLEYDLFINTEGKVEKIKPLTKSNIIKDSTIKITISNTEELTNYLINVFKNITLPIGYINNQRVKYKFYLQINYYCYDKNTTIEDELSRNKMLNKNEETNFLISVETLPEPIGGMEAIMKNVKYPEIAMRAGIEGKVFVKAFIDENGNVVKADILNSAHQVLDSAATNAVMKTKFKPGIQKGKSVKTQVVVPIVFKLK